MATLTALICIPKEALKNGENNQRIFLLNAWKEAGDIFTYKEIAVLAVTEEITLLHPIGLSDETYGNFENALQYFSKNQIAEIIMAIITMNAWNRIATIGHFQPDNPTLAEAAREFAFAAAGRS